ncbi:MAG: dTDP-glucose 4,6-dehydratase [Candidatus Omnitrophota bacterium]|jgi:dTDP-glucose 4,6-dehydratase
MKVLVTGGAGFIGSEFVRQVVRAKYTVVVVDALTYAGDLKRLDDCKDKFRFYKADISERRVIEGVFKKERPEIVINFAAETHVDRSIADAAPFIKTNILGTEVLLAVSRMFGVKRFVHISTDEVYGDIARGKFVENDPLNPSSPYAASKAAADLLIKSYVRTYRFPAIIIRPSNNYGPWQYPEKFIPLSVMKLFHNEKMPLYADGKNVREWLYVEDCALGILTIMKKGTVGEVYNLGSGIEKQNIEVAKMILSILTLPQSRIEFVKDRPGHDIRYRLDSSKLKRQIAWKARVNLPAGLRSTIIWCRKHQEWLSSKREDISAFYKNR